MEDGLLYRNRMWTEDEQGLARGIRHLADYLYCNNKCYPDSLAELINNIGDRDPKSRYMAGDFHSVIRRLWLDTNKASSRAWKEIHAYDYEQDDCFSSEQRHAVGMLKAYGHYTLPMRIEGKQLTAIREHAYAEPLREEVLGQRVSARRLSHEEALNESSGIRFFYDRKALDVLLGLPEVEFISAIACEYLRIQKVKPEISGWLSVGRANQTKDELSNAAQEFHYDYDAFNFLKVFIYLTDVDDDSGPHQFVEGSHHSFPLNPKQLAELPTHFRITEGQVKSIYPQKRIVTHQGPAGSIIIEDTSGFHRGKPLCFSHVREILVLQYKDSDFKTLSSLRV